MSLWITKRDQHGRRLIRSVTVVPATLILAALALLVALLLPIVARVF